MSDLNSLPPRQFEELIARILASFGWEVSLTPISRDGGVDIIGVTSDKSGLETTWAVECKRYNPDRKVGVEIVRQLTGVREALGFDKAVLVTSGEFSSEALSFSERVHGLHLVNRSLLDHWLTLSGSPLEFTHALPQPKQFASCFLSHSSSDAEFASYLARRLHGEGVRVWYAPDHLSPGQKLVEQIDAAIRTFDRLIVVLSSASIDSNWVTTEVRKAFQRQQKEGRQVLFPVSLMPFKDLQRWECIDPDTGIDLAVELRSYFILDFVDWRSSGVFNEQFSRLLQGLRTPIDS